MSTLAPLAALARQKWLILGILAVVVAAAIALSQVQDRVYSTSSTLLVAVRSDTPSFDTVQASQAVARSYADLIDSPNIASRVAVRLGGDTTKTQVIQATSFEAVPETQLLMVNAEAASPERAKRIADTYAAVFIEYAQRILSTTTEASITLADPAPLTGSPSRPRPMLYGVVAAVLGLALGLGLALLRDRLDLRLRTLEDVEENFDVPVLASVPRRGRSNQSQAAFMEAHQLLRTNLQYAEPGEPLRSIAITSAREGEGKTITASNLAMSSAANGIEVILVEADMRRPGLQSELGLDRREALRPGFSDYLIGGAELEDCLVQVDGSGVQLLPAGRLPFNPAVLLERGRAAIAALGKRADLVIFDCPPLRSAADASVIAGCVDAVVLVVDMQTSSANSVKQALRQLEIVNAPLLGLLLNRDRVSEHDYYGSAIPSPTEASARSGRGGTQRRRRRPDPSPQGEPPLDAAAASRRSGTADGP